MKIQQFAEQLQQESPSSPLMESLQAVRRFDLNTLRDLIEMRLLVWVQWPQVAEPGEAETGV